MPNAARAFSNIAVTEAKLVTSHCAAIALTPSFSTSAATASSALEAEIVDDYAACIVFREAKRDRAPTPCPAPVTRPTRPLRSRMLLLKFYPPEFRFQASTPASLKLRDFRFRHFRGRSPALPSCAHRFAVRAESAASGVRSSENRGPSISASPKTGSSILLRWPASTKIDVARQVAASAHDMRRHTRRLQAMLDRIRLLRRASNLRSPSSSSTRLRSRPTIVSNFASCSPSPIRPRSACQSVWIRSIDRDPSILSAASKQTLRHVQWRTCDAATLRNRAVRSVFVV